MKPVKRACLLLLAVVAALGIFGSGSAMADAICKANESPCKEANIWPVGTVFETNIKTGTQVVFKGAFEARCTGSTWSGKLTMNPTSGIAAILNGVSESFSGCSVGGANCVFVTASEFWTGAKWFADKATAGNGYTGGTIPAAKKIEMWCSPGLCTWSLSGSEASTHTYQGGNPASERWSWRYTKSAGPASCGSETMMSGERTFLAPKGSIFWVVS